MLEEAETLTPAIGALNLVIAFNYGARDEIVRAARKLAEGCRGGRRSTRSRSRPRAWRRSSIPPAYPIPTWSSAPAASMRLSNFLLWQAAYSEFVFLPCFWPDFSPAHLAEALRAFAARERRFGGLARRASVAS